MNELWYLPGEFTAWMEEKLAIRQHFISTLECLGITAKGGLIQFGGNRVLVSCSNTSGGHER